MTTTTPEDLQELERYLTVAAITYNDRDTAGFINAPDDGGKHRLRASTLRALLDQAKLLALVGTTVSFRHPSSDKVYDDAEVMSLTVMAGGFVYLEVRWFNRDVAQRDSIQLHDLIR